MVVEDRARAAGAETQRGFTLVELVVVIIIVGVLAALAVPKFIALGRDARLAAIATMESTLRSAAENARTLCKLDAACDYGVPTQAVTIGSRSTIVHYGWLDAGDSLGAAQIDTWINYAGFTASLPDNSATLFTLDGSPDPAHCSVKYNDAYGPATPNIMITPTTTGC